MSYRNAALLVVPLMLACAKANEEPAATAASETPQTTEKAATAPEPAPGSDEWKIQSALSAAPSDLAQNASVMDWPAQGNKEMRELKKGSNGWTCMPDEPKTNGPDPMCLDEAFIGWADAWQNKTQPKITRVGFGYMLQGDGGASLTDPYAEGPATSKDWIKSGPHVMVVVPNAKDLEGLPVNADGGHTYVMWKGTPYAHVMVPVAH